MNAYQIVVAELPKGPLCPEHFAVQDLAMPKPGPGEVLCKTLIMSIDAANRAWLQGATYRDAVHAGDAMPTYMVAKVIESQSERFKPGDIVLGEGVWANFVALPARKLRKQAPNGPLSHLHSVYGIAGKTAFHGLIGVGQPLAGETVLVSAAAGSVGGFVGQIAKAMGCSVVGIAGGPEKCQFVTQDLGFDACVDYRDEAFPKALRKACPNGVDIYFDNVGGAVLEAALFAMNLKGRIVCCGAISQYDCTLPNGPRNLPGLVVTKRLRMEGFIMSDFAHRDALAERALQAWVAQGKLKVIEDIVEGLDQAPRALIGLLNGDNRGKRMVRVAPDPILSTEGR